MVKPLPAFLVASLSLLPALAHAQVKEEEHEIRAGCKAVSRLYAPADAPAELEYRVEEAGNQKGFGSFKKLVKSDGELLAPLMGFNLCDSYSRSGPLAVTIVAAGDYQKISIACGGTWKEIEGEASLTLQVSTRKLLQARVRLEGAYGNGSWHSGIVKTTLESFSCEGADYAKTAAPLLEGASAKTVKGTVSKGVFTKAP